MIDYALLKKDMRHKYRVQSARGTKAIVVPYVDSRDVAERLDEACTPGNWQDDYRVVNGNLYAGIGINTGSETQPNWVWKWDCGTESNVDREKGEASDAFKRAAVKWGVGRFLYRMKMIDLKTKEYKGKFYPAKDNGDILWDTDQITEYVTQVKLGSAKPASATTSKSSDRYQKRTEKPTYTNPDAPKWTKKVKDMAAKVEKDGLKGSEALAAQITAYNEVNKTEYTKVTDFKTDELLESLIKFTEEATPKDLV